MSEEEFRNKFILFKGDHIECGDECPHFDVFYKKMFVLNQF